MRKTETEEIGSLSWAYLLISLPEKTTERLSPEMMIKEWIFRSCEVFLADDRAFSSDERRTSWAVSGESLKQNLGGFIGGRIIRHEKRAREEVCILILMLCSDYYYFFSIF